jgi:hypothetical protein
VGDLLLPGVGVSHDMIDRGLIGACREARSGGLEVDRIGAALLGRTQERNELATPGLLGVGAADRAVDAVGGALAVADTMSMPGKVPSFMKGRRQVSIH